jgi:hypothetical protein
MARPANIRQGIIRGARPDDEAVANERDRQEAAQDLAGMNGAVPRTSNRFAALMGYKVDLPTTGKSGVHSVRLSQPYNVRRPEELQKAAVEAANSGQAKNVEVHIQSRRNLTLRHFSSRLREKITAPYATLIGMAGKVTAAVQGLSATSKHGTNPELILPGKTKADLRGFSGDVRLGPNGQLANGSDLSRAAISMKGPKYAEGVMKTSGLVLGGKSVAGTADAIARQAAYSSFAPSGGSYFGMPSAADIKDTLTRNPIIATASKLANAMSNQAVYYMKTAMQSNYGGSRIRPQELKYG